MKETTEQFLDRGGVIQKVCYKTLEELQGVEVPSHSMRDSINSGVRNSATARRLGGINSGKTRRAKAALLSS